MKVTKNVKKRELRKHKKRDADYVTVENESSDEEIEDELEVRHRPTRMEMEEVEDDYDLLTGVNKRPVVAAKEKVAEDEEFTYSADGKIIFKDLMNSKKRKRQENDDDSVEDDDDFIPVCKKEETEQQASSSKTLSSRYKHGGQGIHRNLSLEDMGVKTGAEFKSRKGKGDSKKKGQSVDPYAYYPLRRSSLNKRKRAAMTGQFKSLKEKNVKRSKAK